MSDRPKICIDHIGPVRELDGWTGQSVFYRLEHPEHPGMRFSFLMQPFTRDGEQHTPSGRLLWQATGPDDALTLAPSYLCRFPFGPEQQEIVVHLFLKDGKIELCGDSTVELA